MGSHRGGGGAGHGTSGETVGPVRVQFSYLYIHVLAATLVHVEVDNLWTETCLHLDIHLVAGLHQLFGQVHVIGWKAVVSTEGQDARQETHQMVLNRWTD